MVVMVVRARRTFLCTRLIRPVRVRLVMTIVIMIVVVVGVLGVRVPPGHREVVRGGRVRLVQPGRIDVHHHLGQARDVVQEAVAHGFADLMPGSGHGSGGWVNVTHIEVYGKAVPR